MPPSAQDGDADRVPRLMLVHDGADVLWVRHLLSVDGYDQVAAQHDGRVAHVGLLIASAQSGPVRRAADRKRTSFREISIRARSVPLCGTPESDDAYVNAGSIHYTKGFSEKVENHDQTLAIHFLYYNVRRVHRTHRVGPAMEAGFTDHLWSIEAVTALVERESIRDGLRLTV